jgi:hypothetical protein
MADIILTKICGNCKELKSLDNFSKNNSKKDGLDYRCRSCLSIIKKNKYKDNPNRYKESNKKWRECNIQKHRENARKWASKNFERCKENKKRNIEENIERYNEYHKNYREINKEKHKAFNKEYYILNSDKCKNNRKEYYKNNPEKVKLANEAWRIANPDKRRVIVSRRNAKKRNQLHPDHDTTIERNLDNIARELYEKNNIKYQIDHIWPIAKGGPHHHENLQVVSQSINSQKNDSLSFSCEGIKTWVDLPSHILKWVKINKREEYDKAIIEIVKSNKFTTDQIEMLVWLDDGDVLNTVTI